MNRGAYVLFPVLIGKHKLAGHLGFKLVWMRIENQYRELALPCGRLGGRQGKESFRPDFVQILQAVIKYSQSVFFTCSYCAAAENVVKFAVQKIFDRFIDLFFRIFRNASHCGRGAHFFRHPQGVFKLGMSAFYPRRRGVTAGHNRSE